MTIFARTRTWLRDGLRNAAVPLGVVLAAAVALASCGGSGSSGFDARAAEGLAITRALDEQRCIDSGILTICPTDAAVGPAAPNPSAGPVVPLPSGAEVQTGLVPGGVVECALDAGSSTCSFPVPVELVDLPSDIRIRVAARTVDPDSPWSVGEPQQPADAMGGAPPSLQTFVRVDVSFAAAGAEPAPSNDLRVRVQIAVLVYRASYMGTPAPSIDQLVDSHAGLVFVSPVVTLSPQE